MEKKTHKAFNKKIYLIGIDKNDEKVYLESPQWDCGHYWGFGYIERYTGKNPETSRDISSHSHADSELFGKREYYDHDLKTWKYTEHSHHINDENSQFKETVLSDNESWKLAELLKQFYILSESSSLFCNGSAGVSSLKKPIAQDTEIYKRINKVFLPQIFKEIDKLLSPKNDKYPIEFKILDKNIKMQNRGFSE